ncbi:MAG TPA: NUDIX hydrolase [Candidatus Hydrogenedentes bacterium]|nr:NUDIX hydrolase [Candidatus Hydrogenedentota bacterium]
METWLTSDRVFQGRIFSVRTGTVRLDEGQTAYREVVEHPGGVCVLPWTGHVVILVRQFRIALGHDIIEAPAGKLEGPNDDPSVRGLLELEEEVGFRAARMTSAGIIYGTVGFCSEKIHLFVASGLTPVPPRPEPEERIERIEWPVEMVEEQLRTQALQDAKTIVLLERFLRLLRENKVP